MLAAANLLRGRGAQARQHPGEAGVLRSLRTSFNCGSPSTLSHASLPRTALGWTLLCNMKLSHLAFNANPRLPFVKQRAKTQVANVEAGSETELMPPRLALHAGVDRRVAEVQLELLACAGVTWSRVETRGMYVGRGDSGCNLRSDNGSQTKRRTYDDR